MANRFSRTCLTLLAGLAAACGQRGAVAAPATDPYIVVLGVVQDGGFPQAGTKPGDAWRPDLRRYATCIAIVDPATRERWIVEATPDFRDQLHELDKLAPMDSMLGITGILITHAHIGHYSGLTQLGREVIGAREVPVHVMPRMRSFLERNGPWDQLVQLRNIELRDLSDGVSFRISDRITITPFLVPHRDEYSETVGFRISGPRRTAVFLPDIDKWERWDALGTRIESLLAGADVAYLDGTFFRDGEVPGRAMSEIPHPFISETMQRLAPLPESERGKIRFIHLNRTNPAAFDGTPERRELERAGFRVARMLEIFPL